VTVELPQTGLVAINAAPWGRVLEIADDRGALFDLPTVVETPLALELPLGNYRITIQYADPSGSSQEALCEVEVTAPPEGVVEPSFLDDGSLEEDASLITEDGEPLAEDGDDGGDPIADPATEEDADGDMDEGGFDDGAIDDGIAHCNVGFGEPDTTEFFKTMGWWQ
jgi:hypothetical protein